MIKVILQEFGHFQIKKYLNKNGIFISDDINDNLAFKHFCDSIGKTPIIFKHKCKFVGLVKK